ncbi:response regulator [Granulicella cerasi]|uniref:Response regulator n=1 Tax=Granulicella cerasi TaxID=741063 RepID=A0ABW1Z508_9BACT|nr:response regulator [Granulicella cerasi]
MDIFVVDDEVLIVETLAAILRAEGYSVRAFRNATAVLDALHPAPRLLITDYHMPDLRGTELIAAVRRCVPDCPVILFSADLEGCYQDWHQIKGSRTSTVLIQKPLHPVELVRCVGEFLSEGDTEI